MIIFTPNTVISSTDVNGNFDELSDKVTALQTTPIRSVLSATFTSTTSTSYQDTGLKITLPTAGTYIVQGDLRPASPTTLNDFAIMQLYNETTSTEITDSHRLSGFPTAGTQLTMPITEVVTTTTANNIIRVNIKPSAARTCQLSSDVNGRSVLIATRIS